jgi:oligopeptide transport system substrate-binding protein
VTFLGLFTKNSAYNWTAWNHPEYERLMDAAAVTANAASRYELFQQAEALLLNEAPVTPLYFGAQTHLLHPAVKGWEPAPLIFRRFQALELKD